MYKKNKDKNHNYSHIVTDVKLLQQRCADIDLSSKDNVSYVKEVIYKMQHILNKDLPLSYGISAIQVGHAINLFLLKDKYTKDYTVYINAKIENKSGIQLSNEGCDSLYGERYLLLRPKRISLRYDTLKEHDILLETSNSLLCRCISHEVDHQNGILINKKGVHINKIWLKQS